MTMTIIEEDIVFNLNLIRLSVSGLQLRDLLIVEGEAITEIDMTAGGIYGGPNPLISN
jgi:hypothetical protein